MDKRKPWSKIYALNDEQFKEAIFTSRSISDVLRKCGLSTDGSGSRQAINRRIKDLGISPVVVSASFSNVSKLGSVNRRAVKLEDVFSGKATYVGTNNLKKRMIKEGLIKYECSCCGISEWKNKRLSLQLDHIDGNRNNNSRENLRLLCPNCHSQTDTFAGRGKTNGSGSNVKFSYMREPSVCKVCGGPTADYVLSKTCAKCMAFSKRKVVRPTKEELERLVWASPTSAISVKIGVSDKAVEKWCKQYGISKPPRGHWSKMRSARASDLSIPV